jgi:hypothetical protein
VRRRLDARGQAARGDHGVITVLFGLILSSMLIVAAIVVDLGMDRATVRSLKTDTDLAAIAGGYFMAGNGQSGDISNPHLACDAILNSVKANVKDFPTTPTANPGNGCAHFVDDAADCDNVTSPMKTVTFTGAPYVLTVQYPIPDSELTNPLFDNSQGNLDKNDGKSPCARMRITLSRANPAVFSGIIGGGSRTITQTTVFKINAATVGDGVPALLILERLNCNTLSTSGQGGIMVSQSGSIGGWIHSDTQALAGATISNATGSYTSNCGSPTPTSCTSNTANLYSMYATALPGGLGSGPAVVAQDNTSSGADGIISTYAASPSVNGAIGCEINTGINHATTGNPIVSRSPVDKRYNLGTNPYGENITGLHARGYGLAASTTAPAGYQAFGFASTTILPNADVTGAACSANNKIYTAPKVWINCPAASGGFTGQNVVFTGTDFIFTGPITAKGFLAFPNAKEIFVRGSGGSGTGLNVPSGGRLSVNTRAGQCDALADATSTTGPKPFDCSFSTFMTAAFVNGATDAMAIPSNGANSQWPYVECLKQMNGPGGGGDPLTNSNHTTLAMFSGSFDIQNAEANLCQTFVYMGANTPAYAKAAMMSGGNCSASLPCPSGTTNSLLFTLNSGSAGPVQWTSPLLNPKGPSTASPFDDLALWTEGSSTTSAPCYIKGQGQVASSGIFFMPSCPFSYGGQAASNNPVNAQFIVRTLTMAGQGILFLKPNPDQSIQVPHPGGPEFIR